MLLSSSKVNKYPGAEGGSRTHMRFKAPQVFETCASAIPPPRRVVIIPDLGSEPPEAGEN